MVFLVVAALVAAASPVQLPRPDPAVTGIVLLHGKGSSPGHLAPVARALAGAGYLVATPELPWSAARAYDRALDEAHEEIDASVAALRARGATRLLMAGHSMGANVALGYTVTHPGIEALLMLAPGQTVETRAFRDALGESLARARRLVADGRGDEANEFADLHLGTMKIARMRPRVYVSYFDPAGLTNMPETILRLHVPLLWAVGTRDRNLMEKGRAYAFARATGTARDRYLEVVADHMGTPDAATSAVLAWLSEVAPAAATTR
jgi:pimeloyl-ACP methyl ester carboxylesterase